MVHGARARLTSLIENLERADLTPIEEARAFAKFLGVSETTVSKHLPQEYKDEVKSASRSGKTVQHPLTKKVEKAASIIEETKKAAVSAEVAVEKKADIIFSISYVILECRRHDTSNQ